MLLYAVFIRTVASLPNPAIDLQLNAVSAASATQTPLPENRLDLNAATAEELASLPGIGEKTAQAILALRDELGRFRYPEDLLMAHGIGEGKLDAIYDLVYTEMKNEK